MLLINFLIFYLFTSFVKASDLPIWIRQGELSGQGSSYVICSHEAIDPEKARAIAEDKCLESAVKSEGVEFVLDSKTILTTVDSEQSDIYEVSPLNTKVKCQWTHHFLEKLDHSFRVWLRCRVTLLDKLKVINKSQTEGSRAIKSASGGSLRISVVPRPDFIQVYNATKGIRHVQVSGNDLLVELKSGDVKLLLRKIGYRDFVVDLSEFKRESVEFMGIVLSREY